jgi:hypothetical protein
VRHCLPDLGAGQDQKRLAKSRPAIRRARGKTLPLSFIGL